MRFSMDDGVVVDTKNAARSWHEATRWDGRNQISVNTGSQWTHEMLYQSRKGRYYVVSWSDWQGSTPAARFVSDSEAAQWLILNDEELPEDLEKYELEVSE